MGAEAGTGWTTTKLQERGACFSESECYNPARDKKRLAALRESPPAFPPALRVHRVQGHPGIWEVTFAPDGRATFEYTTAVLVDEPHVIWRRIGTHAILAEP